MKFTGFQHLNLTSPLAVLDAEATGTSPMRDRVIEVAVVRVEADGEAKLWQCRVNPGRPIPPAASAVHGITDEDVAMCPPFSAIADTLAELLSGCDLGGYNIKRFDLPLLLAEFGRCGAGFSLEGRAVLDAYEVFGRKEPRTLAGAVRFYTGAEHEDAHQAAADALATARVLDAQVGRYPDLPRTPALLAQEFASPDLGGRFRLEGGQVLFAFGKHRGRPLAEVVAEDREYLLWMLQAEGFLDDAKRLVREALRA